MSAEDNNLKGTVPSEIGQLAQVKNMQFCTFGGEIGLWKLEMSTHKGLFFGLSVIFVALDGNSLTGTLPTELGGLESIEYLDFCTLLQ